MAIWRVDSGLLRDLGFLEKVVPAVVKAAKFPVMDKTRIRVGCAYYNNVGEARWVEGLGIAALTVHPRTRRQAYKGKADWAWIREAKQAVGILGIGNGDVVTPLDVKRMYGGMALSIYGDLYSIYRHKGKVLLYR